MQNTRPRQEVETKRRNIILDRLRKKPLEKQVRNILRDILVVRNLVVFLPV